jgi:hypothetical protein
MNKDGGPAFPTASWASEYADKPNYEGGMTLRDYFAAKAMALVSERANLPHTGPEEWAAACYEIADAMLAERAK